MRALITGGSGFLGGHLVDECVRRGDQVRVLVRPTSDLGHLRTVPGIELVSGDLTDPASLRSATRGMDVIYHSAARVHDFGTRAQFWSANVTGTQNLLAAARSSGVPRFVQVSSPSAVMSGDPQIDIDESVRYPDRFLNLYSETKAVAEQIVLDANSRQLTTCAIRPRGIWGPRDRTGFLPRLLAKLHRGALPDLSGPGARLCLTLPLPQRGVRLPTGRGLRPGRRAGVLRRRCRTHRRLGADRPGRRTVRSPSADPPRPWPATRRRSRPGRAALAGAAARPAPSTTGLPVRAGPAHPDVHL